MPAPQQNRTYSFLKSFPKGINSYVDPLLLPPDQLSFATNATVRGNFVTQRPNFFNLSLIDNTGGDFQAGLFQGACYFRTATSGYIMAAVNGKLFQISINAASTEATVNEIPIPSQNSTTATQNWLWQSGPFLVWNDGINLPIFFDGNPNDTRRSLGATPVFLQSLAEGFTVPAINQYVTLSSGNNPLDIDLNGDWPVGVGMVLIGNALYYVSNYTNNTVNPTGTLVLTLVPVSINSGSDSIKTATNVSLTNQYCGLIKGATDNSGNAITVFPDEPAAGTQGNELVLTVLADTDVNPTPVVPNGTTLYSSKYYQGVILSATQGGSAITNWPTNIPAQVTVVLQATPTVSNGESVSIGYGNTAYLTGTVASWTAATKTLVMNVTGMKAGIAGTTLPASMVIFGTTYDISASFVSGQFWNLSGTVTAPLYAGTPSFVLNLSQSFGGSVGDTLQVGTATMTVASISGASVTCQMTSASTGVTIPLNNTVVFDNNHSTDTPTAYGVTFNGSVNIPAVGDTMDLDTGLGPTYISGMVLYCATGTAGKQVTMYLPAAPTTGLIGQELNYFKLTLSEPFTGTASMNAAGNATGDVLSCGSGSPVGTPLAYFQVGSVSTNGYTITCQMTAAGSSAVGNLIPISSGNPSSLYQVVTDTTVTTLSLTLEGVTLTTAQGGSNTAVPALGTPFTLSIVPNVSNEVQAGMIVQCPVNTGNQTDVFYVVAVAGGSTTGTTPSIQLQNINDTAGNQVQAGTGIYSIPELPISRMGCYGLGRNWVSLPDGVSYVASDATGSSTGSAAYDFQDAVLKVSQNYFLASGLTFKISGAGESIQAMQFVAQLDTALGQGPLQIFTDDTVFSNLAPADATTWANLTSPIQAEALIGSGAISQDAVIQQNDDLIFRMANGGIQSMLMATLDFNQWGNTPISNEVIRSIGNDNPALLPFTKMTVFNNRLFMNCQLAQAARGVYGAALVSLNFDPISSLAGKAPSVWEGEWDGLNVLELVTGFFNGSQQCFALCLSADLTQIQIVQIQQDGAATLDNGSQPVTWTCESPMLFKKPENPNQAREYLRLINGEFSVKDITGNVSYTVFYKPDQNSAWTQWYESEIVYQGAGDPGYRRRIPIGEPSARIMDPTNNQPMREGYNFQVKFQFAGSCTLTSARIAADIIPEPEFGKPT